MCEESGVRGVGGVSHAAWECIGYASTANRRATPPTRASARLTPLTIAASTQKWPAPAGKRSRLGLSSCKAIRQEDPVSRILSCAVIPLDAASPRTFISDLPGGFDKSSSRLAASGRCVARPDSWPAPPSLFGLAPCGVYPALGVTAEAVRSYRTISPLPWRWSSRNGERGRKTGSTRVLRFQGRPPASRRRGRGSRGGIFSVALAVHGP